MIKNILIILIILWTVFSLGRLGYNYLRLIPEMHEWLLLNENNKKEKAYGNFYQKLLIINQHTTTTDKIAIIAPGSREFFLGRYFLYPKKILWANELNRKLDTKILDNASIIVLYNEQGIRTCTLLELKKYIEQNNFQPIQQENANITKLYKKE